MNAASFDNMHDHMTAGHLSASREELVLVAQRAQMLLRLYENSASDDEIKSGTSEEVSVETAVRNVCLPACLFACLPGPRHKCAPFR